MLNANEFVLLAGRPEEWDEEVRQQACRAGDPEVIKLPELQEDQHVRGHRSVELVKSGYAGQFVVRPVWTTSS